jgi:hypothetical protein
LHLSVLLWCRILRQEGTFTDIRVVKGIALCKTN